MKYIIGAYGSTNDRTAWLNCLLNQQDTGFNPKPPQWWVRAQVAEGRTESAAYSIWHRYYKPERKYIIWDQALDEDWKAAGYLVE